MPNTNRQSIAWHSHGISDVGKVRDHNEDSLLERAEVGMWVVADGMGGHTAGDVASQMIINSLGEVATDLPLDRYIDDIEDRLVQVNKKLIGKAEAGKKRTIIGSTVVVMLACENYCVYLWAGDSRLYRLRKKELRQMTTDHSQVEQYIKRGIITREEATFHPDGNMITRAVGATRDFFLDMDIQEIEKGDRYLLCSDGLTKHVEDYEFEQMLTGGTTEQTCKALIDLTLSRGAGDNVTAIIIDAD